jgi:hypothetical protein
MKYADLFKEHDIKPGEPGTKKIQGLIDELLGVEKAIPIGKKQLQSNSLSAGKRKALEKDLKAAEDAIPEMDKTICEAIEVWLPRREEFAKKTAAMKNGKNAKNTASNGSPAAAGGAAPAATATATKTATAAAASSAAPAGNANKPDSSQQQPPEKRKSGWGWVLGGLGVLVLAVVGVNIANRSK